MPTETSPNDVFRFVQLRPRRSMAEVEALPLRDGTALARGLSAATASAKRAELANSALRDSKYKSLEDLPLGSEIAEVLEVLGSQPGATIKDLQAHLPTLDTTRNKPGFGQVLAALSDTLLAALYATTQTGADLAGLQNAYRVYHSPAAEDQGAESLSKFLSRPLLTPVHPLEAKPARIDHRRDHHQRASDRDSITHAVNELVRLDRPDLLVQPTERGAAVRGTRPFTLKGSTRQKISAETSATLRENGIDLANTPIDVAVQSLYAGKLMLPLAELVWPRPVVVKEQGVTLPPEPASALVQAAGVADLLVVKQQIKRYEGAEIAHVENVLIGEKKSRAHRHLERSEETLLTESEVSRTLENELETADRFELSRETSRTIEQDQKIGGSLSLSGKYGPSVEFSSTLSAETSSTEEDSSKNSTRFAKDVVSRSLERITERLREVRSRTVIRETEETNLHELNNQTNAHVSGIYQFLDKVYEAQVFNYGIREMFDFMIPEPASFLWYVAQNPTLDLNLPPPPERLELVCPDASHITEDNAVPLAAEFGADIEGVPPPYVVTTAAVKHGQDDASESGQPRSVQQVDVAVPPGYRPLRAWVRGMALTDQNPVIAVSIGTARAVWRPGQGDRVGLSGGRKLAHQPTLYLPLASEPYELSSDSKLPVLVVAYETNIYSVTVSVVSARTEHELDRWRLATYKKIRSAYEDRMREYEQEVERLRTEAEAKAEQENRLPFGAPPAANEQTIRTELRKHCLSLITQQRYDAFDATHDGQPPYFDFVEATAEGAYVRFFEQAFEWDQMQYVFYPYFWSRKTTWVERFVKQEIDPQFLDFLKAGAARVVVPARPGFERAVTHFLETGKLWGGDGEPPQINSPLYLSILDEIRERTGAPEGEIAVGDPWEARVPTALVLLRPNSDLPHWQRAAPDKWEWAPGN